MDPVETDPLIGRMIGDRYRVLGAVGRGGMGAVYRVEHVMMKKELALKLLHPELSRLEEVARRFEREAEAAARLDHPHIITVTDFGRTDDGQLFLVMELLAGPSLADVIRPDGEHGVPLDSARAVAILKQVLRALEHAHASGVVHRDLKPENIVLIERDGERDFVKLLDFGIAKLSAPSGDAPAGKALTQAGVVFGTPEYLSPEQAMGEEADGRADLYAAGVMLFELLTGRRPFESASSKVEVLSKHLTQPPPRMREVAPQANVPELLERVVARALEKKRDQRFPTAAAFLDALSGREPAQFAATAALATASGTTAAAPSGGNSAVEVGATGPKTGSRPIAADLYGSRNLSVRMRQIGERLTGAWTFLVRRSRELGVPWPRAFVAGLGGLVVALLLLMILLHRSENPPAAAAHELAADLRRVEAALARGELEPARAALQQLRETHPESARVRFLYGNLDFAAGDRERALADYHEALKLDPGYQKDPILRGNVRASLDKRESALPAVALLADDIGAPALADLTACARNCKDEVARRRAAEAALKLGGAPAASVPGTDGDGADLEEKLKSGRSCKERKAAALQLIDTNDRRYLDALKTARDRTGGFLGLQSINGCMRRELDAAIRRLEKN